MTAPRIKRPRPRRVTGPKGSASTVIDGRTFAEYLGDGVIRYTHERCGFVYEIDHASKPKNDPKSGYMSPAAAKHFSSWWSREKNGCIAKCPRCDRERARLRETTRDEREMFRSVAAYLEQEAPNVGHLAAANREAARVLNEAARQQLTWPTVDIAEVVSNLRHGGLKSIAAKRLLDRLKVGRPVPKLVTS